MISQVLLWEIDSLSSIHTDDTLIKAFHSQLCSSLGPSHSLPVSSRHTLARTHSHHRCHGGDGGHLIVFCPRLQVLQSVEGGVMQAEGVWLQRLAQRLLESFLLKLQHQPVGLLPLSLSLLCSLSPTATETKGEHRRTQEGLSSLWCSVLWRRLYKINLCFNREVITNGTDII